MSVRDPFDLPVAPVRAALLFRFLYALLAFDLWITMIPHAGRYGVDGFNVAHFAWLDALLPPPSARLYVCVLASAGMLALRCAVGPRVWPLRALLALFYTWAWALSMHDSYQHHYLLSWLLLAAALSDDGQPAAEARRAPAFVLVCFTCATVYAYTAVAKLAPDFRGGLVLKRVVGGGAVGAFAHTLGLSEANGWRFLALGALVTQLLVAAGYLAATGRDEPGAPGWRAFSCTVAAGAAVLFHVSTELAGVFAIGWFSYYMLGCAACALLPRGWLDGLVRRVQARTHGPWRGPLPAGVLALAACCAAVWLAQRTGIPGLALGVAIGSALVAPFVGRASGITLGTLCLTLVIALSPLAFDYHRRLAGELERLGRARDALQAYREAERVAPLGRSRQAKIRALEERVLGPNDGPIESTPLGDR